MKWARLARIALFAVAAAFALQLDASVSYGQDADTLITEGVRLREQGRDDEALALFRRAYDLRPSPRALAQMGLACQALGRWGDAETHLRHALEAGADPWIATNRATLEQALAVIEGHLGTIEIRGNIAGAELRIDGRLVGTLPLATPIRIRTGRVTLEVSAPGHYRVVRDVTVVAGGRLLETIDMQPLPATQEAARSAPPLTAPPVAPSPHVPRDPSFRFLVYASGGLSFIPMIGGQDEEAPGAVVALGPGLRIRLSARLELTVGLDVSLRPGWANRSDRGEVTSGGMVFGLEAASGLRLRPAATARSFYVGAALALTGLSYSGTYVQSEGASEERVSEIDGTATALGEAGFLVGGSERWDIGMRARFGWGFSSPTPTLGLELRVGFALL